MQIFALCLVLAVFIMLGAMAILLPMQGRDILSSDNEKIYSKQQ